MFEACVIASQVVRGVSRRSRSASSSARLSRLTSHTLITAPACARRIQPPMLASWSLLVTMISSPGFTPGSSACVRMNISAVVAPPITTSSSCGALISSATARRAASTFSPARCEAA